MKLAVMIDSLEAQVYWIFFHHAYWGLKAAFVAILNKYDSFNKNEASKQQLNRATYGRWAKNLSSNVTLGGGMAGESEDQNLNARIQIKDRINASG